MYTLTRKLSVVCLTVVLSFLAYGCGGGSKQALITDVSTDMVTAGLTPDSGTYLIQPGGTATAGDVTFACPEGGPPCEVTVAEDGTVTSAPGSAPGMATATDSDSATRRLDAEAERDAAIEERDAANMAVTVAEGERDAANMAVTVAEGERDAANMAVTVAEGERDAANMAVTVAEGERDAAVTDRDAANMAVTVAEGERDAANMAVTVAEGERDAANMAVTVAEGERDTANMAVTVAEGERDAANMAVTVAEGERNAALELAEQLKTVTPITPDLATGYGRVTPGDYEIPAGGVRVIDDIVIACNAAIPCTVVITLDGDDEPVYTSLGGVATIVNSSSVVETRIAVALTAVNNGLANLTVTVPDSY